MMFALAATTLGGGLTMLFGQGTPVNLQPTTPGTQQIGNTNISGRMIASSVHVTDPSPTGQAIVGSATSTTGANFGGFFRSDSPLGRALYGRAAATTGTTSGIYGQADSPAGRGVTGVVAATTGNATGVWGQTASTSGRGVYGYSTAVSGESYGVFGQSSSPEGFGIYSQGNMHATGVISGNGSGVTNVNAAQLGGNLASAFLKSVPNPLSLSGNSTTHIIRAENTATTIISTAIQGVTRSTNGSGVYGLALATDGTAIGVRGQSAALDGIGVSGIASSTSAGSTTGVYGESKSRYGSAVFGYDKNIALFSYGVQGISESPSGTGVFGRAESDTGNTYGVRGFAASSNGFAVYAAGKLGASGTKSFRIDHPLDPENKYLLHYSTESPVPQNFYVGNVVTDARGYAWVTLPDYFGEINKNFKYQLTIVDDRDSSGFAMAKVSKKIRDGRFQIRTSEPNVEVSWRVDADRNDLFVRNQPAKDVVDKPEIERGTYQHPELYGFGPERGLFPAGPRQRQQNLPSSKRNR